jgi:transposase
MIDALKDIEIRRLYFAEHWKVGTIAAELSLHPDAVKRAINAERMTAALRIGGGSPSPLDPFKDFISTTLEQYPRLRSTRLFEMLKARGYAGGVHTVRRYVRKQRPRPKREAFFRVETLPGEQGQVDWAHFGKVKVGTAMRTLSCFVMVLGHSRGMFARFFFDQTTENFLRGHVEAFDALGGVPRTILYDNLKSVVLDRVGDHVRFNPRILDLAGFYHFAPRPCAPYRGNEKGKVERTIHYLRYSFFEGRSFTSLAVLNSELRAWIDSVAHARIQPGQTTTVAHRLSAERPVLMPLPEQTYVCDSTHAVVAKKTPYVRFDLNDYSIPHTHVGLPLSLVSGEHRVRILDGLFEVANHERSYDRARTIEHPAHLAALEKEKRRARELRGRHRLVDACPQANALLSAAAQRNESLSHYTLALLRLLDRVGPKALSSAIAVALERGSVGAASIEHLLEQERRRNKAVARVAPTIALSERASALRTISQPLSSYDSLGRGEEPNQ